jgi:hypothetical protein
MHATSLAKLVRLCEGVKLVGQDNHRGDWQGTARFAIHLFLVTNVEEIRQEWRDFLVSLQPFRSQRIERLRVSAEITTA